MRVIGALALAVLLSSHAGATVIMASGPRATGASEEVQVPVWDNTPVLSGTQSALHGLEVGDPFSIDLKDHMSVPGTTFSIVGTSRADDESVLPAGISLSSDGVLSGTPSEEATVVIKVRAHLGTRDAAASWLARRALAHAYDGFEDDESIQEALDTNRADRTTWDDTRSRSGPASMHQVDGGGTNQDADWWFSTRVQQNMSGVTDGGFAAEDGYAPGETMVCAFALYTTRDFVQHQWPVGGGVSSHSTSGKIAIIDGLPWAPNLNHAPTANDWEMVLTPRHGGLWGYTNGNGGSAWNFDVSGRPQADHTNGNGNNIYQPAVMDTGRTLNGVNVGLPSGGTTGGAWTANQQERAENGFVQEIYEEDGWLDGRPDPLTAAGTFPIDGWVNIKLAITIPEPPIEEDGNPDDFLSAGGTIDVWMAQDGQDYQLLYHNDPHWVGVSPFWDGGAATNYFQRASDANNSPNGEMGEVFGGINFTTLFFDVPLTGHPTYEQWIDEIQCGEQDVPAPDFDGTGNYRTADVLVTLKVNPSTDDSVLEALASSMSPGDWLEITDDVNFTLNDVLSNTPGDNAPITEFMDKLIVDETYHMVHLIGCARGGATPYECGDGGGNDSGFVSYRIEENDWVRDTGNPIDAAPHAYNHATINQSTGVLYYWQSLDRPHTIRKLTGGIESGTWSTVSQPAGPPWCHACSLEYFPETDELLFFDLGRGFQPKVCITAEDSISWDCSTNISGMVIDGNGFSNFSRYSPDRQLIYTGGGEGNSQNLTTINASHTQTVMEDAPSGLALGTFGASGKQAVNPCNGNLIALDNTPKNVWEFDPTVTADGTWTDVGDHPLTTSGSDELQAALGTLEEYDVIMVVNFQGGGEVYLYKPSSCSP